MTRLTDSMALQLFHDAPLAELQQMAHAARCKIVPDNEATYLIMRIVSYTNICVADCKYCAFYRRPGDKEGYVLSTEQIFKKIDELIAKGGSLVAMEGGFNPALKIDHYENLFKQVRERYGDAIEIYGPTSVEVLFIARNSKIPLSQALERLKESGLRWIPGGGAEILTPEWRKKLSPKKYSVEQYMETMETAQKLGFGTTATMVIGFGEPFEARVEHLRRVRELQDKTNGFASFLCWTYQSANTALGGNVTPNEDYLRTMAVSRLYLDNIDRIRASILTQGEAGALALRFGADDFDIALEDEVTQKAGVQIEDNVEKVLTWVKKVGMKPTRRKSWHFPLKNRFVTL
ncbi:MAG: CofH family radical SAM protein [Deltaproteobacteria bacterium]|nr:CofH family radical SAM protein [Deltaproteobacteria bacterium]